MNDGVMRSPYSIRGGPWTGKDGYHWRKFPQHGGNVYEFGDREGRWIRVWSAGVGAWREPTASEKLLPCPT